MKLSFWGVRGSIAVSSPDVLKYGGNTSCISIETASGDTVIFDAGTGIRNLGGQLMAGPLGKGQGRCHIFFSHTHWDHIQGLPFFVPIFIGKLDDAGKPVVGHSNRIDLYAPKRPLITLRGLLRKQMRAPFFPVDFGTLGAQMRCHDLISSEISLCGLRIKMLPLNHPDGAFGFRIEEGDKSVAYITDTEHTDSLDLNVLELVRGVDIMIYDSQYTPKEYPSRRGWGHSTWVEGVKLAQAAGVGKYLISHHDPRRKDADLDAIIAEARTEFPATDATREGWEITL